MHGNIINIIYLGVGLGLGALLCYLFTKGRLQSSYTRDISQREAEDAVLRERLQSREDNILELKARHAEMETRLSELQTELAREQQLKSAAEEKSKRVSELETVLEEKEQKIAELINTNIAFREKQTELQTRMEEEARAMQEKMGILIRVYL